MKRELYKIGRIIATIFNEYTSSIFHVLIENQHMSYADIDFNP